MQFSTLMLLLCAKPHSGAGKFQNKEQKMQELYNVKKKAKVQIDDSKCSKVIYSKKTKNGSIQEHYAIKAIDDDGTHLTKFITKAAYESLKCKAVKA